MKFISQATGRTRKTFLRSLWQSQKQHNACRTLVQSHKHTHMHTHMDSLGGTADTKATENNLDIF